MRTSRLGRWMIRGTLVAAGAVAAIGGQTVVGSVGAQSLTVETLADDVTDVTPQPQPDDGTIVTPTGWDWT